MRNTRIVWSLAALILVLLGIGVGGYAQLGSASSHLAGVPAVRSTSLSIPAVAPQPPTPERTDLSHATAVDPMAPIATTPPNPLPPSTTRAAAIAPVRSARSSTASAASPRAQLPRAAAEPFYVVQPHDTLWSLAAVHLGNPYRWVELFDLNRGRSEPGGQRFVNPDRIYVGWTLEMPRGVTGRSI
jgi:nucleoid-associated protein YgaU